MAMRMEREAETRCEKRLAVRPCMLQVKINPNSSRPQREHCISYFCITVTKYLTKNTR
jgi:hypothetical protein